MIVFAENREVSQQHLLIISCCGQFHVQQACHTVVLAVSLALWQHLIDSVVACRPLLPESSKEDDVAFSNRLTVEAGVTVLPVSTGCCLQHCPALR